MMLTTTVNVNYSPNTRGEYWQGPQDMILTTITGSQYNCILMYHNIVMYCDILHD